jgi:ABC-type branched-subunit amino acid transport system substrate-binding protein
MRAATSSNFVKKSSVYLSGYTSGFFPRFPRLASHLFNLATKLFLRPVLVIPFSGVWADELEIPILVGQTGSAAVFGRNETDAYTLAIEEWNSRGGVKGSTVVPRFEDTKTSARDTLSAFQHWATRKGPVMLGPTWLDGFQGIIPAARRSGILLVTPSAAIEAIAPDNRDWPVSFYHNSTLENDVLLDDLLRRGFSRIALIYEQEPFAEMLRKLAIKKHPQFVSDTGIQAGEADFTSVLVGLKSKKPDLFLVFVWDERSLSALLKQIKTFHTNATVATIHDGEGWLRNDATKLYLTKFIYSRFVPPDQSFGERFKRRFGYDPILTASNAYDALNATLEAIDSGAHSGREIRDYLLSRELRSVTLGRFRFNQDGSVPSKVEVVEHR